MRIAFNRPTQDFPLYCDSIGYHWQQGPMIRKNGYYAFHWLQSEVGTGVVEVENQKIVLAPDQGIFLLKGVPHRYMSQNSRQTWQTAFFTFDGTLARSLITYLGVTKYLYVPKPSAELLAFPMQKFEAFNQHSIAAILDQSTEIYRFVMLLKQNEALKAFNRQNKEITMPIIEYINQHYAQHITNQALAAVTQYSITYQNRIFKQIYHITPLQYLTNYRLQKARELLLAKPEWEVKHISLAVGFQDTSQFIHQFKKVYRVTPQQFKKFI
ncbi:AraC family transcriptional regulator [Agrilactobacillus fermenti]|uniref:AraC family transcriptional regulator n=1 Tax=Agrilactobacillus fermenti TaxID=2586909 RepID=UPI001E4184DC|nr:AraC family transcriptional regulator [Agrilactobacillus fermenti]MCD2255385.1 AraC family transcriptional regulator [Agrilactobacillus fermenti]